VKYLGFIISTTGTKMDPAKITTIQEWPQPQNMKDVQSFLGFANFYCRFIKGYSSIVAPLTRLTRKDTSFTWTSDCAHMFNNLKTAFTTAPILRHFDYDREVIVEMDASNFVSAGVLSLYDDNGILHPVTFFSHKHSPPNATMRSTTKSSWPLSAHLRNGAQSLKEHFTRLRF
jgi:hypothetical protein